MGESDPPVVSWSREVALAEVARILRRLPFEDFERDVRPRLARLTREQRVLVEDALCILEGDSGPT